MRNARPAQRLARGFTLIELLVVIIIIAILAAVVVPRVIGRTEDARIAKASSDISTIDTQIDVYKLDTGSYPTGDQGLQSLITNTTNTPKWNGPYLKNGLPNDPWSHPYLYKFPGEHGNEYDVYSAGADGQPGSGDDIGNWNLQK